MHGKAVTTEVAAVRALQRQTSENVFLIYKTARTHSWVAANDGAKGRLIYELAKEKAGKVS